MYSAHHGVFMRVGTLQLTNWIAQNLYFSLSGIGSNVWSGVFNYVHNMSQCMHSVNIMKGKGWHRLRGELWITS